MNKKAIQKSILIAITLLLVVYTNAQTETYKNFEKDWNEVEQFESKGLPKSALAQVEKIYTKAKKKENHP
ncbi:MAG: hypothetical protein HKN90_02375, partial [Flavobacteriaceae bacterium]|nr:hypothetical protein [Flavobacteriaceae bacterium]